MSTPSTIATTFPSVVEILGPAGAGKTTLLRVLTRRRQRIVANADVGKAACAGFLIRNAPMLLPGLSRSSPYGRRFTWDETRAMAYLEAWHRRFGRGISGNGTAVDGEATAGLMTVFDHGPLFRLARLYAFGPTMTTGAAYGRWWGEMLRRWVSALDLVIYLDAPDEVLSRRIDAREHRHQIKGRAAHEVSEFLARYRTSFEEVLATFGAGDSPRLLRFDTTRTPAEQVADRVMAALGVGTDES